MPDHFADRARSVADPAVSIFEVVPDDANDLPRVTTALNVATPGTVRATLADGSIGDFTVAPGQAFPIRARRIWLTGTTATGLRGLT